MVCTLLFNTSCELFDKESDIEYGSIYGTVSDEDDNQPIVGASVVLSPGSKSTVTGNDGTYEFTNLEPQQYKLQVTKSGYTVNSRQLTISAGESMPGDITMRKVDSDLSLSISPTTYDFGTNSSEQIMTIENISTDSSIDWVATSINVDWLELDPSSGTIAFEKSVAVKVKIDRSKLEQDEETYFMIEAAGGSEAIKVVVQKEVVETNSTGIPSADENSEKPYISTSEYTISTIPSPIFNEESSNENIVRVEFNGIQKPGTTGSSASDFQQLFGTGNENQNTWIEVNNVSMGFMVQNGSDLGVYEQAQADIIFLVDNSGSMGNEADKLAEQIISWSATVSQTMDVKFGCVGYNGLINGAIDITDQNSLSSYLDEYTGVSRTKYFGGANSTTLQANATLMNNSESTKSDVECGPMALYYADENLSFRSNANRIFINMTDEYSTAPTPDWSVETINPAHSTYNWSASQGVIHTIWSGGSYSSSGTYYSWEQPWLMSEYTGGTIKLDAATDYSNVDLDELPVTGAILYSYVVLIDNTSGIMTNGSDIRITIKSDDGEIVVVSEFEVVF